MLARVRSAEQLADCHMCANLHPLWTQLHLPRRILQQLMTPHQQDLNEKHAHNYDSCVHSAGRIG